MVCQTSISAKQYKVLQAIAFATVSKHLSGVLALTPVKPVIAVRNISFNIHKVQFAMPKHHYLAGLRNAGEVCFLLGRN
jgi:phosphoribosylcarboxyaminoimidazole (NCAIR) mutase